MAKDEEKKCEKCHYCKLASYGDDFQCRKNPPLGKFLRKQYDRWFCKGNWPQVESDDWCGSFLLKADNG